MQTQVLALIRCFDEEITSWETDGEYHSWKSGLVERSMFFLLHTENGVYQCDIRDVMETLYPENQGVYSIFIFPALSGGESPDNCEAYESYCVLGRENAGIFLAEQPEQNEEG